MKTLVVLLAVALFAVVGCNAQNQSDKKSGMQVQNDQKNSPKESWTVKKEVDENGNVIGYDSTYTWSYSTINGDSLTVNVDSLMNTFQSYFNETMPSVWGHSLMDPMLGDSLLGRDLFSDNYFHERWKDDFFDMDKMFEHMDSLRNSFFDENFPEMKKAPDPKGPGIQ